MQLPTRLPEDLDLVDHLRHAVQPGNGGLRQLLQIEAGDLAAEIELPAVIFAPDPLHAQVRVVQNTVFRQGKDLVGLRFVLEGFQDNTPLEGPAVKNSVLSRTIIVMRDMPSWQGGNIIVLRYACDPGQPAGPVNGSF